MAGRAPLYEGILVEHGTRPRNFRPMPCPDCQSQAVNPLCGDELVMCFRMNGDVIEEATFQGHGCAVAKASASLLTEAVRGKSKAKALALHDRLRASLESDSDAPAGRDGLDEVTALEAVRAYPLRLRCATLAWEAMAAALTSTAPGQRLGHEPGDG